MDISARSICGTPQLRTSQNCAWLETEKHTLHPGISTPKLITLRWVQGVRGLARQFAIQNSWKRVILPWSFSIPSRRKQEAGVAFEFVRLTVCVTGGWGGTGSETGNCHSLGTSQKNAQSPSRPVHAVLGSTLDFTREFLAEIFKKGSVFSFIN